MDDASLIKTIARFKIDVTGATTPLKSLQAELLKVDQQVKKIQSSFGAIGQSFSTMGQSFGATGSKISATAKQTGASIQKVTDATINQLAQIEKQLMSTMSKAGTLGVAIPGAKGQLEIVRQLQDQLMVGQQITEETAEQIQNASMYATLQSRRIATLEKEIVLNKTANTQQQIANASQQRSALAREQALRQQRLQQEKMAQAIMRENALHKQSVFSMEAKVSATMKQLTTHKLTDSHVAQQLTMLRAQIQEYQQLLTSGKILSKIEMDRLRNLQIQLGVLQAQAKTMITDTTAAAKQRAVVPGAGAGGQSVLGSQYERRISWFLAGAGFYGGIRAMQSAVSAMKEVESQMAVIERTTQDATFQLTHMRDELMGIGKEFGHGWSVVSEAAVEWTRAGYNVADTLELVRTSLLALNVAEMDLNQATAGLIAIMSQWGLQAEDLVTVIDKLNIISDRFPVTTGDLIDALLRSSGAARAANIEFDELVGMITATRTASGRAGGEIGNAMNTILSYITRQSTLNKLMASGVEVFEDAAQTKLRPALEIMTDVTDKWLDNAEQMPKELIDIADSMGLFEEELADVVGLQEEWTDLQKIEIEQGMAGVRRRQFLIALMRNFGQVQDVVNNLQEAEGYSMIQNIRAMQTLEKQVEQLRMEMTKLATALGDAGVLGQMKQIVGVGKDVAGFFAGLDSGLQTLILTLGEMTVLFSIVKAVAKMMGAKTVVAALASPYALPSFVGATAIAAYVLHTRQLREEYEQYLKVVSNVAQREEQLNKIINTSIKDTLEHNMAVDEKRELNRAVLEQYPHLLDGYDAENELLLLNQDALKKAVDEQERLNEAKDVYLSDVQKALQEQEQAIENQYKEADGYDKNAKKIEELAKKRESLIKAIQDESLESEKRERYMAQEEDARRIIIDIVGDEAAKRIEAANWSIEAINKEIEAVQEKARITREAARERIKESKAETEQIIKDAVARIEILNQEMKAQSIIGTKELKEEMGWFQWYFNRAKSWLEGTWVGELFDIAPEPWAEHKAEILELEQVIAEAKERLAEYDEELIELIPTIENVGGGTGELSGETQKLSDIINKYIETALRAAEVQAMLNNETQRTIDGMKAKIDYHSRDAATAWERAEAYRTEIEMVSKLREKQEGVHQEANFLREALTKLEARQKTLDITTEDGWESYKKLESQIESIKDSVEKLGIEWFRLAEAQEIGISDFERINSLRDTEIKQAEQSIKYLTREASTKEEVALADEMRIRLIELYNEKLLENQNRMRESEELLIRYRLTVAGIKEGTDEWDNANRVLNRALVEHQSLVQSLTSENYSYMESLEEIRAKTYMQIRLEKEREEEAKRLKEAEEARREAEQEAIRQQEEAARKLQQAFQDAYSHVNDLAKLGIFSMEVLIAKTREAYTILSNVRQLTLSEEMSKVTTLQDSYREYFRGLRDDAIKYADEQIDHYRNIISEVEKNIVSSLNIVSFFAQAGILSTKELIEQTRVAIADLENVSLQDQVGHISTLAGHYRTYFDDILNRAREVHDQQIAMIREQADAKISAIREEIALLDEEAEAESREEAEKQHIQKIEDLQEERRYHELRTGREHTQAIVDIDKQIKEEMNQWELKQKRWQREDKKVELKKEIDDIEDATKNEIDLLNDKWEDIEKFFKGHTGAMLALAAAYDEDFAKIIESQMAAWIEQIEAGEDATDVWRELTSLTPQAESVVTSLENHITQTSNTAKEAAKDAKNYLEEWEQRLEELREEFSEHNISMLALAAALNPEFFETAKTAGEGWLEGFKEGTNGWEDLIGALVESARNIVDPWLENLPLPGGNGTGSSGGATDWPSDTQWGGYMYYDKDSGLAKVTSSLSEAMSKGKGPIHEYSGPHADGMAVYVGSSGGAGYTNPLALSEYVGGVVATANGEQQTSGSSGSGGSGSSGDSWGSSGNYTGSSGTGTGQYAGGYEVVDYGGYYYVPGIGNVPKSHKGSMVVGEGIASLTPGELVFPPDLSVQLQRLISTLSVRPLPATQLQTQPQQQWRGGGVEIRGNLLNVEKASFEDETDMEILARELNRQIALLRN